jgi:hypothetical protein
LRDQIIALVVVCSVLTMIARVAAFFVLLVVAANAFVAPANRVAGESGENEEEAKSCVFGALACLMPCERQRPCLVMSR